MARSIRPARSITQLADDLTPAEIQRQPTEIFQLDKLSQTAPLRQEWLNLATELPHSSYFQTPDWVLSWWQTVGRQPPTVVAIWRETSGAIEAITLLSRVWQPLLPHGKLSVPAWINTGSGPGAADHCGWLTRPERKTAVQEWIFQQASSGPLLLQNLDPEVGSDLPSSARAVQHTECPRLLLMSGSGEVGRSSNFRQQLRATERKLQHAGVRLRWVDPDQMSDQVLQTMFSLHQSRWQNKGGRTNFTPDQIWLHRRLMESSACGRGPAAVIAEHEERAIGILYGFWWKDVFSYYQMGWDPGWARYNIGTMLLREGIRMTAGRGGRVFDFLRGTERFKYRFGAQNRNDTTWLLPRGWSGGMLSLSFAVRGMVRSVRTH